MRLVIAALAASVVLSSAASFAQNQTSSSSSSSSHPASSASISVPRLINLNGVFRPADGQPVGGVETVMFAIYTDESGGAPIWQETQQVQPDASGRYTVLLGATQAEGVPPDVFASGEARWLGMIWSRGGESQNKRSRLTFVPYAVHAADADTLGGKPASAYVLTSTDGTGKTGAASAADPTSPNTVLTGVPGQLAKYAANGVDIMGATTVESGGRLGVGTAAPLDYVHAQFTDNSGGFTGFAVQNLSGGAAAFSGTLFYDQLGNLGQFQGFNNSTHEYRINNVAKNGPNFNGSINFMIGGTSRFFVASGPGIGIGTTIPATSLEVSNATTGSPQTAVSSTTIANSTAGGAFIGRHARGTGTPTAALSGDNLAAFLGAGFGTTTFSNTRGGMFVRAAENWTDAAQGTSLAFNVTPTGTVATSTAMTITPSGQLGIGTTTPAGGFEVSRALGYKALFTTYEGGVDVVIRKAHGANPIAPSGLLIGNEFGAYAMAGYGATAFGDARAGMFAFTTEDWTDTAQGGGLGFAVTPNGTTATDVRMAITSTGHVGIGTMTFDVNDLPILPDQLHVIGDIRVGTAGTNGCLKDFSGTGIVGTCSSDLRLKKDITPFGAVLDRLTALQPVHYFWRASEFPERHFGDTQAAGLIAQDVEQVLPELVETDKDGFKAVNYSKLPLFTIQAMKELKSENDVLKQRVDQLEQREQHVVELEQLKQRVAELERLLADLRAATVRR